MLLKIAGQSDDVRVGVGDEKAEGLLGHSVSASMRSIEASIADIAAINIPVLISGETGTGKDWVGLTIHRLSRRVDAPFVKLRCSGLKRADFDRLLMGCENESEPQRRSTVFLDEISEISMDCQTRILESFARQDESNEQSQLGGCIISTTSRDLNEAMRMGDLRRDLYYRLSAVCLRLPPLRERRDDILPLARFFLNHYAAVYERPSPGISAATANRLSEYSWPGNVRELKNAMKRLAAFGGESVLLGDFGEQAGENGTAALRNGRYSLKQAARAASRQAERDMILKVLSRTRWNRKRAAEELQISYKALLYKLKQIGLEGPVS